MTWAREVAKRLAELGYHKHSFDRQLFIKVKDGSVISMILVYVDDFIGVFRADYNFDEVYNQFKWGALDYLKVGTPVTFKGKDLLLSQSEDKRVTMKISMAKFISSLDKGIIPRGRLQKDPQLSATEQKELRSVSGCLQWLATQSRPEIAPIVSLTGHGASATVHDLKALYQTIDYLKQTPQNGIVIMDLPLTSESVVLAYSDSSWGNASKCGTVLDWKSARSARVCRSTLAAEASAADEAADRSAYINMFISELTHQVPAHRSGCRLSSLQSTDSKSLYDSIIQENPSVNDKRTMVSIRAIQESVTSNEIRWTPTKFQFADGLTKADDRLRWNFTRWLQSPFAILTEHEDNDALEKKFFGD